MVAGTTPSVGCQAASRARGICIAFTRALFLLAWVRVIRSGYARVKGSSTARPKGEKAEEMVNPAVAPAWQ